MSSKYLQQAKEYYHLNKDKVKEYQRKNKERIKKYQQEYFQLVFKESDKYNKDKKRRTQKTKKSKKKERTTLPTYKIKKIEGVIKEKYKRFLEMEKSLKRVDTHNSRAIQRENHSIPQPRPFSGFIPVKSGFLLTW
jgi:hypothetical protein